MTNRLNRRAVGGTSPRHAGLRVVAGGMLVLLLSLLLAACGSDDPTATPTSAPTPTTGAAPEQPGPAATPTPTKEPWEIEWDELIVKAQEEGQIVIVGRDEVEWGPIMAVFTEKFGIKVSITGGNSSELSNRILAERAAGRFTTDHALFGTGTTSRILVPNDLLKPILPEIILPEVKDESLWQNGHIWWATGDPAQKFVIMFAAGIAQADMLARYNTNNVTQEERDAINSVWDFLDPRWKGRVGAMAPTAVRGGTADYWVHPLAGPEWFERFYAEMEPIFFSEERLVLDQLATGGVDLALFLGQGIGDNADVLADFGAPIGNFKDKTETWAEGGFLNVGTGNQSVNILAQPAHPSAAQLMVNWLLSKEGQTAWHTEYGGRRTPDPTMRSDVTDWGRTDPLSRRQPGKQYFAPGGGEAFSQAIQAVIDLYQSTR